MGVNWRMEYENTRKSSKTALFHPFCNGFSTFLAQKYVLYIIFNSMRMDFFSFFVYCQRPTLSFVVDTSHSLQMQKCKNAKEYLILLNYTTLRYHRICKTFAFSLQKGEKSIFEGCLVPSDSIFRPQSIPIAAKVAVRC